MPYDVMLGKRAARYQTILLRCDLGEELHKRVAAELGIGIRQFYRERQALIEALSEILPGRLRRQASSDTAVVDVSALELARARTLQYGGEAGAADGWRRRRPGAEEPAEAAQEARPVVLSHEGLSPDAGRDGEPRRRAWVGFSIVGWAEAGDAGGLGRRWGLRVPVRALLRSPGEKPVAPGRYISGYAYSFTDGRV